MEFRNTLELEAHKGIAHDMDQLELSDELREIDDPSLNIPFEKIFKRSR